MFGNSGIMGAGYSDSQSPIIGTLTFQNVTKDSVELTCSAVDNIGVNAFKIFIGGIYHSTVVTSFLEDYVLTGFDGLTEYTVYVSAVDATGNESGTSNQIVFTTLDPTPNQFIYITTTSISSTWTPTIITNTGDVLLWAVTGGVTITEVSDNNPIFDLSSNTGTATIAIRSQSNFLGLTELQLNSLNITSTNVLEATDLTIFSCKLNTGYISTDVSTLVNLDNLVVRSNALTSLDISNNIILTSLFAYSNILDSISVISNPDLIRVDVYNNNLPTNVLEQLITDLDSNGAINGILNITNNLGAITSTVYTEYQSLITKGWAIDVASPADPAPDTIDPVIGTLTYNNVTETTIDLFCTATDNVEVVSYDIYEDAVFSETVNTASLNGYSYTGLTQNINYDIFVTAKDAANNESLASNIINFTTDSDIILSNIPILSNFRVEDGNLDRVYFDSSESITGTTSNGFIISGKILSATLHIETSLTTGHYITVTDSDFNFWDNNTIRYVGGSDIKDLNNNEIYNFTMQHIINNITEPLAINQEWYVDGSVASSGNGTTEALAFKTIMEGVNAVSLAGATIHIKAYDYGAEEVSLWNNFPVNSPTTPYILQGYKTVIGDLNNVSYYAYGDGILDGTDAPLIDGGGSTTLNGLLLAAGGSGTSYMIIRNIQSNGWKNNFIANGGSHYILDNCVSKDAASGVSDYGLNFYAGGGDNTRFLNVISINAGAGGIKIYNGNHSYIDGCKVYGDKTGGDAMDYYFTMTTSNSIYKNNLASGQTGAGWEHGFSLAGDTPGETEYNLIENHTSNGDIVSLELRRFGCGFNTVRNLFSDGTSIGVRIRDGAYDNIVENMYSKNCLQGIDFTATSEPVGDGDHGTAYRNKIINSIIYNSDKSIYVKATVVGFSGDIVDNEILNCTFYNDTKSGTLINQDTDNGNIITYSGNLLTNCIVQNVASQGITTGWTFTYNNNYDFWGTNGVPVAGAGNISVDSEFTDAINGDFTLSELTPSTIYQGGTSVGVEYDKSDTERVTPYSMGAYEYNTDPLFHGAVGFGADWVFTNDYEVIIVTNLNNSGTGSLREAITSTTTNAGKIIVFNGLSGIIEHSSILNFPSGHQIYIAGQTSENGIVVHGTDFNGALFRFDGTENGMIIRGLFFDRDGSPWATDVSNNDCISIGSSSNTSFPQNIIFDHCTFTAATDEIFQMWEKSEAITIQNCIIAEPVGDGSSTTHLGHLIGANIGNDGANKVTLYNNAYITNKSRTPSWHRSGSEGEIVSNVIYNSLSHGTYFYENGTDTSQKQFNFINNHYIDGPETNTFFHNTPAINSSADTKIYAKGNLGFFRKQLTDPEWDIFRVYQTNDPASVNQQSLTAWDYPLKNETISASTQALVDAQYNVVGTFARIDKEMAFLDDIANGTGTYKYDTQGAETPKYTYIAASISAGTIITDTNNNGIPDSEEGIWGDDTFGYINDIVADESSSVTPPTLLADAGGETNSDTEINLTWTKSVDGVMTNYRVYVGGVLQQTFGDVALGTLTGLSSSTTYNNITVRAWDGATESSNSNSINVTTEAGASNPNILNTVPSSVSNSDETTTYLRNTSSSFDLAVTVIGTNNLRPSFVASATENLLSGNTYTISFDATVNSGTPIIERYYNGAATIVLQHTITSGSNSVDFIIGTDYGNATMYFNGTNLFDIEITNFEIRLKN